MGFLLYSPQLYLDHVCKWPLYHFKDAAGASETLEKGALNWLFIQLLQNIAQCYKIAMLSSMCKTVCKTRTCGTP